MKRSISFIFVVVFIFGLWFIVAPYKITSSAETNLLYNGDFNSVAEGNTVVDWEGSNIKVDGLGNGNYCVKSKKTSELFIIYQSGLNLDSGKYKLEFKAQINNGSCNIEVGLRVDSETNVVHKGKFIENYNDFTTISVDLELSESGVYELYFKADEMRAKVSVDDMKLFAIRENGVKTAVGAEIRTVITSAGLRFKGSVDKNLYDGYVSQYGAENVQVGMIIAPTDFLSDCDFTYEALSASKAVQVCVATFWNNESTAEADGYYGFNCAFINILPYNTDRKFSFRSFLRYNDGDNTTYLYSDYDGTDNARSVYDVAVTAKEENSYVGEQLEVIEYFCDIIDYPTPNIIKNGNTFTLTFSGIKGYFALDYDRNAYSLSNVKITMEGDTEKDFGGMEFLAESTNLTLTLTVDTATTLAECPVRGRVYRID